jgi:hypothetical protein
MRLPPRHRAGVNIEAERACDLRPQEFRRMATDVAVETRSPRTRSRRPIYPGPDDHARIQDRVNDDRVPAE